MKLIFNRQKICLALCLLILSFSSGCSSKNPGWTDQTEILLGTVSQIRVYGENRSEGEAAVQAAFRKVEEIESRMSIWHSDSQIAQINAGAGRDSITVTDDVLFMIEEGLRYYEMTDGLFHIGLGTLTALWGFNANDPRIPDDDQIQIALESLSLPSIQVSGNEVMIRQRGTAIDLGGIAKGYAVDEAARELRDLGVESAVINFGGDVYAIGLRPDDTPWSVGIKEPIPGVNDLVGRMLVSNLSVVTSGDYERYMVNEETGERFHHILDPRTGRPVRNELVSVTIVSDTALEGDILSTTAFIMGLERGYEFIYDAEGVEGLFITNNGVIYLTPGLEPVFELMNEAYVLSYLDIEVSD